eukprot:3488155-Karenia_brevis.AAC.1
MVFFMARPWSWRGDGAAVATVGRVASGRRAAHRLGMLGKGGDKVQDLAVGEVTQDEGQLGKSAEDEGSQYIINNGIFY